MTPAGARAIGLSGLARAGQAHCYRELTVPLAELERLARCAGKCLANFGMRRRLCRVSWNPGSPTAATGLVRRTQRHRNIDHFSTHREILHTG